jgi:hypothetical protein
VQAQIYCYAGTLSPASADRIAHDVWRMIRRRAVADGIAAPIGNHTFRATPQRTSATAARLNTREMAAHASPRTTKLYDPTKERLIQDEA